MYTIFYDTGNDIFFDRIVKAFCDAALKYIVERSNQFMQENGNLVDAEKLKDFLERENRRAIAPLNCGLFFPCPDPDQGCKENYRAVLTSDQIEYFAQSMKDVIIAIIKHPAFAKTNRERLSLQEAFQRYDAVSERGIKQIKISSENNAMEYKKNNRKQYMSKYVEGVRKILDEEADPDADIFVYVRAQTSSHFKLFREKIKPQNLRPCDHLQVI